MIIVEGPDGAGKSTLVGKLGKDLGLLVGERATTDRKKLYTVTRQDTYTALGLEIGGNSPSRIWDRLFFSEMVYAPIVGRTCEFTEREQTTIKRIMMAIGVPIIVCYPPLETVLANVEPEERDEMDGVKGNITNIYKAYNTVMTGMPNVMHYDYTGQNDNANVFSYEAIVARCEHWLKEKTERMWS